VESLDEMEPMRSSLRETPASRKFDTLPDACDDAALADENRVSHPLVHNILQVKIEN